MSPIYASVGRAALPSATCPRFSCGTRSGTRVAASCRRALSNVVVTVDVRSFPLSSAKVVATGHGIDLDEFPCVERSTDRGLHLLSLGRYSQAKGIDTVLRAVAMVPEVCAHPLRARTDTGGDPMP